MCVFESVIGYVFKCNQVVWILKTHLIVCCLISSKTATMANRDGLCVRDRTSEQQNMRLGHVLHVVDPAARLLHANRPPLLLGHQVLGQQSNQLLGQHDMPKQ